MGALGLKLHAEAVHVDAYPPLISIKSKSETVYENPEKDGGWYHKIITLEEISGEKIAGKNRLTI
jgi:hypothetical protein